MLGNTANNIKAAYYIGKVGKSVWKNKDDSVSLRSHAIKSAYSQLHRKKWVSNPVISVYTALLK